MTSGQQSVRDYLVTYANERDWSELWPRVMGARASLLSELAGVSEEQAWWRPPSGEGEAAWSIAEVVEHVLTYTRNVVAIIEGTARGEAVVKDPPGAISGIEETTLAGLLRQAVEASAALASIHLRLPEKPTAEVTVGHVAFGGLNYRSWFLFMSWHDASHTRQISELKGTAGFPAS